MTATTLRAKSHLLQQFYELTKPRVVSLIVFCAVIGMFLAVPAGQWISLKVSIWNPKPGTLMPAISAIQRVLRYVSAFQKCSAQTRCMVCFREEWYG